MTYTEIRDVLITLRKLVSVEPLTEATHDSGMTLAERYGFSFHDSLTVAATLLAGGEMLYSEDLQADNTSRIASSLVTLLFNSRHFWCP